MRSGLPAATSLVPYRQDLSCLGQVDILLNADQSLPAVTVLLVSMAQQGMMSVANNWQLVTSKHILEHLQQLMNKQQIETTHLIRSTSDS